MEHAWHHADKHGLCLQLAAKTAGEQWSRPTSSSLGDCITLGCQALKVAAEAAPEALSLWAAQMPI